MKPWQNKEKRDAKTSGGKVTPRSGGLWFAPGDVKSNDFLIDSKTTDKNRFSVTKKMWKKIYKEALLERKMPMLSAQFGDENIEIVVLSKDDFFTLFDNIKMELSIESP